MGQGGAPAAEKLFEIGIIEMPRAGHFSDGVIKECNRHARGKDARTHADIQHTGSRGTNELVLLRRRLGSHSILLRFF
jgi:hypothetical protein